MPKRKTQKKKTHTIVISDLHLGSEVSQPKKALAMLKSYSFRKLILLGDVLDSLDFRNLSQDGWAFLNYIGKISKTKKIRWVVGNHDAGFSKFFGSLIDADIHEVYRWEFKNHKYLAIHGHQFDRFLVNNAFISWLATSVYNFIQRLDSEDKRLSHWLKRKSKGWLRLSDKVSRSALRLAKKNGAKYIFCGHTHKAMQRRRERIKYFNCGCWTDTPCTYITIDEKDIRIREF